MYGNIHFKQGREPAGSSKGGQFAPGEGGGGAKPDESSNGGGMGGDAPVPPEGVASLGKDSVYRFPNEKDAKDWARDYLGIEHPEIGPGSNESGYTVLDQDGDEYGVEEASSAPKPAGRTMQDGSIQIDHGAYQAYAAERSNDELRFIVKDAGEAIHANPEGKKMSYYSDELLYAAMELSKRVKNA